MDSPFLQSHIPHLCNEKSNTFYTFQRHNCLSCHILSKEQNIKLYICIRVYTYCVQLWQRHSSHCVGSDCSDENVEGIVLVCLKVNLASTGSPAWEILSLYSTFWTSNSINVTNRTYVNIISFNHVFQVLTFSLGHSVFLVIYYSNGQSSYQKGLHF